MEPFVNQELQDILNDLDHQYEQIKVELAGIMKERDALCHQIETIEKLCKRYKKNKQGSNLMYHINELFIDSDER